MADVERTLSGLEPFTLDDMGAMHNDVFSERASEVKGALLYWMVFSRFPVAVS